jgi:phosphoribosylamine--glycine ligase
MRVLVVGSGGREHAIVDKLRRDEPGAKLYAAPGNPGIAELAQKVPLAADDIDGLAGFAQRESIDLTVVGPEVPLAAGIVDLFQSRGVPILGPTRAASRIEASKAFAKRLMQEQEVPTADFVTFTDAETALAHVRALGGPLVVKASGLAAGKGAIVCPTTEEALAAVGALMVENRFGDAGAEVVIEEFMEGMEVSVFFLTDGDRAVPLLTSRDYKRVGEGDLGLNTGGMGAYSPASPSDTEFLEDVRRTIAQPVLEALAGEGCPYRGFLYAGLMLTVDGPRVVEFNCRLGDPETQAVLPLTASNLLEPMLAIARGEGLGEWVAHPVPGAALVTVLASAGYPESSDRSRPIELPAMDPDTVRVYHAGTAREAGALVSKGGRVLGVTGLGANLEQAARNSREAAGRIHFDGVHWRGDIGWHELSPDRSPESVSPAPPAS